MYINCPKCSTNFIVLKSSLASARRRVKCSKCSYVWSVEKIGASEEIKEAVKIEEIENISSYIPKIEGGVGEIESSEKASTALQFILPIFLGLAILFMCSIFALDHLGLDGKLKASKNIVLKDVRFEKNGSNLIIKYKIYNNETTTVFVPKIRIRLKDSDNCVLDTFTTKNNINLKPKQYANIKTEFGSVPLKTSKFDVSIGTNYDFILR